MSNPIKNNLLQIDEDTFISKKSLVRWTPIAKECYKRGCNCDGCNIVPKESFHEKCNVKNYVKGYILLGKYPK